MSACHRLPEIEAAHDRRGTLDAEHLATCDACRHELERLRALSARLAELKAEPVDDVAVARVKLKVMGATRAHMPRRFRAVLAAAAAVAFIASAGALAFKRFAVPATVASTHTRVQAVDEGLARWTMESLDDAERIELSEGTLQLSVTRPPNGKKVIVQTPDGTIEDIGTVFHVVVQNHHTNEVRVDQGAVRLTLVGVGVVDVRAGETWSRSAWHAAHAPSPAEGAHEGEPDEDAAYLTVVRSSRAGEPAATREAARRYLEQFPNGFRAPEVRGLIANP